MSPRARLFWVVAIIGMFRILAVTGKDSAIRPYDGCIWSCGMEQRPVRTCFEHLLRSSYAILPIDTDISDWMFDEARLTRGIWYIHMAGN